MEGTFLRFYVEEKQTHHGVLLWEWLLQSANQLGVRGGSAFRSIGGFGRHRTLHASRFFELAGSEGIEVEFIASESEAARLLELIEREKIRIVYSSWPAHFAVINPDEEDASGIEANKVPG